MWLPRVVPVKGRVQGPAWETVFVILGIVSCILLRHFMERIVRLRYFLFLDVDG
jgi:hypothetical protein